ncbi:MAG: dihydrolipoamide acetyltransferase family protein [Candidatus Binatia bacterium]|jgi:pyruvate dehydrogenase E2 component (dihydrolipoamide acetyltransferase)
MPTEITMPKLSDTMEEGTILRWYKHEGEHVEAGEVLAEVETDKADMEVEASASGTLAEIRVQEGASAAVGAVIAVLSGTERVAQREPQPQPLEADAKHPAPPGAVSGLSRADPGAPAPHVAEPPRPAPPPTPPPLRAAPSQAPAPPPPAPSARWQPQVQSATAPRGTQQLSKLRQTVAKQMTASKREVPHFYVTVEVDMSEAARLRASISASGLVTEHVTFTHLMMRALALVLQRHPRVNASWSEGGIIYHDDVNIGVAVAVEDGLVAPVVRACQHLSLRAIAQATNDLVEKAQAGRFGGEALTGATFTLSNMGMLDVEEFSAVITPPQTAILAVGAIKERPVVRHGQVAVAKTVRVTLSVDHRVLTGVEAARFLEDFKRILEHPLALVLGPE